MVVEPELVPAYIEPRLSAHESGSLPNSLGTNKIPTYPDLLHGTNCLYPAVPNYQPPSEVDVFILGAGPVGLAVASCLVRQGVSIRIVDKSPYPLPVGRADALQPRTMEIFRQLGLGEEVFALGPRIEHTVIYKDGKRQIFAESHQSPTAECRYQGLHDATQTEVEHVFIRDLIRHDVLVERPCTATSYSFDAQSSSSHPISVNVINHATGAEETVTARFLVGCDGAHSMIRKSIPEIKFDGIKTDLHWGIVDAVFETDFPHRWTFGTVLNSEHGGCLIIPRERDMVRLYAQLRPEPGKEFDKSKWGPEEVLEQLNKIYAPYTLKYASPVDWFTILTINERVASTFSYKDRIFLAGDSCHVHSAKGAFGMNTGIGDAHNLAWKLAYLSKGIAKPRLLETYDLERRENALRAVRTSARYLRFVGNCTFQNLDGSEAEPDIDETQLVVQPNEDLHIAFFKQFAQENTQFLIGLDIDYAPNAINLPIEPTVAKVRCGYRAPDPRVSLSRNVSARLHDVFGNVSQFTILIFGSNLGGPVARQIKNLDTYLSSDESFYKTFEKSNLFKLVLVVRASPSQADTRTKNFPFLYQHATVVYDDQLPPGIFGADAHSIYGVSHDQGAVVVVRPDTWVGTAVRIADITNLKEYFDEFIKA